MTNVQNIIEEKLHAFFGKIGVKAANLAIKEFEIVQKISANGQYELISYL
jgi:hypothetical protein